MSELITMTELTDTELDGVCGGFLNFNWGNTVTQSNSAENFSMPVLSFVNGAANQSISQTNSSSITQTFTGVNTTTQLGKFVQTCPTVQSGPDRSPIG